MKKNLRTILALTICVVVISAGETFFFSTRTNKIVEQERLQYSAAVDAYNIAKDKYETEYNKVIEYKKSMDSLVDEMSEQIVSLTEKLNQSVEELNAIYEERQQAVAVEAERYASLSDEEKEYEKRASEYNEMISYLRKNNPDYETVYLKIFNYLDADVGKMSSKEIKTFYNLILEKHKYEAEYKKQSKDNQD